MKYKSTMKTILEILYIYMIHVHITKYIIKLQSTNSMNPLCIHKHILK